MSSCVNNSSLVILSQVDDSLDNITPFSSVSFPQQRVVNSQEPQVMKEEDMIPSHFIGSEWLINEVRMFEIPVFNRADTGLYSCRPHVRDHQCWQSSPWSVLWPTIFCCQIKPECDRSATIQHIELNSRKYAKLIINSRRHPFLCSDHPDSGFSSQE